VNLLAALTREREIATVMVTHDLAHLGAVDRWVALHDGKLTRGVKRHYRASRWDNHARASG
jgi:putative ABC transport system ATP-binding protein